MFFFCLFHISNALFTLKKMHLQTSPASISVLVSVLQFSSLPQLSAKAKASVTFEHRVLELNGHLKMTVGGDELRGHFLFFFSFTFLFHFCID